MYHNNIRYYKYNPIKEICQKQEKLIQNFKQSLKEDVEINRIFGSNNYEPATENELDLANYENDERELKENIYQDDDTLEIQPQISNDNETNIINQKEIINNYKQQIEDYKKQLHDLCYIYNNNLSVVQYQIQQINNTYAELGRLQEHCYNLQNQIKEYEERMSYHNKMTNAFNTLLENPEYFYQLMMASMTTSSDTNQNIT